MILFITTAVKTSNPTYYELSTILTTENKQCEYTSIKSVDADKKLLKEFPRGIYEIDRACILIPHKTEVPLISSLLSSVVAYTFTTNTDFEGFIRNPIIALYFLK
jgi:hypothetical protein